MHKHTRVKQYNEMETWLTSENTFPEAVLNEATMDSAVSKGQFYELRSSVGWDWKTRAKLAFVAQIIAPKETEIF